VSETLAEGGIIPFTTTSYSPPPGIIQSEGWGFRSSEWYNYSSNVHHIFYRIEVQRKTTAYLTTFNHFYGSECPYCRKIGIAFTGNQAGYVSAGIQAKPVCIQRFAGDPPPVTGKMYLQNINPIDAKLGKVIMHGTNITADLNTDDIIYANSIREVNFELASGYNHHTSAGDYYDSYLEIDRFKDGAWDGYDYRYPLDQDKTKAAPNMTGNYTGSDAFIICYRVISGLLKLDTYQLRLYNQGTIAPWTVHIECRSTVKLKYTLEVIPGMGDSSEITLSKYQEEIPADGRIFDSFDILFGNITKFTQCTLKMSCIFDENENNVSYYSIPITIVR